jgi:plastocyanin
MFRKNATNTALSFTPPSLTVNSSALVTFTKVDARQDVVFLFSMSNPGDAPLNYTIDKNSSLLTVSPANGDIAAQGEKEIAVIVDTATLTTVGRYDYALTIESMDGQTPLPGSPYTLPVTIIIAEETYDVYLPTVLAP